MCKFGKVACRKFIIGHLGFSEIIGCKSKRSDIRAFGQSDTSGWFSCEEELALRYDISAVEALSQSSDAAPEVRPENN